MAAVITAACTPPVSSRQVIVPSPSVATVTVRNNQWADIRVYVATAGGGHRLGLVPAMGAMTFGLPRVISLPSELRFVAVPIAAEEGVTSQAVVVVAGEQLVFNVENAAHQSTLLKRP